MSLHNTTRPGYMPCPSHGRFCAKLLTRREISKNDAKKFFSVASVLWGVFLLLHVDERHVTDLLVCHSSVKREHAQRGAVGVEAAPSALTLITQTEHNFS